MIKQHQIHKLISILVTISMLWSMFPSPILAQRKTSPMFTPSDLNSDGHFASSHIGPSPAIVDHLATIENVDVNNLVLNEEALQLINETSSQQDPQSLVNPIALVSTQSTYIPSPNNNEIIITYTIKNNRPPSQALDIDLDSATITDTLQAFNYFELGFLHNPSKRFNPTKLPEVAFYTISTFLWNNPRNSKGDLPEVEINEKSDVTFFERLCKKPQLISSLKFSCYFV